MGEVNALFLCSLSFSLASSPRKDLRIMLLSHHYYLLILLPSTFSFSCAFIFLARFLFPYRYSIAEFLFFFFFLSGNISNNESVYYSCTAYPSSHLTSWGKVDCTHMLSRIRYARLLRSSNPSWQVVISAVHWPSYRSAGRRPQPFLFPCWQWRHPYKI